MISEKKGNCCESKSLCKTINGRKIVLFSVKKPICFDFLELFEQRRKAHKALTDFRYSEYGSEYRPIRSHTPNKNHTPDGTSLLITAYHRFQGGRKYFKNESESEFLVRNLITAYHILAELDTSYHSLSQVSRWKKIF